MNPGTMPAREPGCTRRGWLESSSCGFGMLALADLLARDGASGVARGATHPEAPSAGPLAVRPTHLPPRAKRVIFLFMHGGPSHVDTFDYKPELTKRDGQSYDGRMPAQIDAKPVLMASPWAFHRRGESGLWVSDLLPHMAGVADDLCVVRSVHSRGQSHGQAVGVMLPHVVRLNATACGEHYADLARAFAPDSTAATAGDRLAGWISGLLAAARLQTTLAGLGIAAPDVPRLAAAAAMQWTAGFNPRPVTAEDLARLYEAAR